MPPYDTANRFSKRLFKTMWGVEYEFKNRWKQLLDGIAAQMNTNMVTRVDIFNDGLFINHKMCATLGLLGGEEDIRVEDIVNFKMTAKKFPMTSTLRVDGVIYERAQIELGDPETALFEIFPRLQQFICYNAGTDEAAIGITRRDYESGIKNAKMQEIKAKAEFKRQMDVVAAAKDPHLSKRSPGQKSKIWSSAREMSGNSWSAARNAVMEKDPKLFKAARLGLFGALMLGGGAVLGAGGWLIDRVRRR